MSLRSAFPRGLALAAATGALVATVTVVPAVADDGGGAGTQAAGTQASNGQASGGQDTGHTGPQGKGDRDPRRYQGVVTARDGLWLRDRPDRGSRRVRFAEKGETVSIYCKAGGETVGGNPLWYLLTDGTWAWGAARYIDNVGPAPRWC
ncbi:SH3 domain-containing protein [Streptomyces sp. NBC_00820]|uniref:SH3 domain-containing protein n=1 Tax=Streptomyces sp. NBC_00820 TaxID=2975842 RepID=UPI002ED13410|nr:SH3 domain-containing protein [Streptomyces sp. NBC_00820]